MKTLKSIISGIIILVPATLLIVRFLFYVVMTALVQVTYKLLGQGDSIYWTVENEWVQFQMDMEHWWHLWRNGNG